MARRRFFVDEVRRGRAVLEGEDARHLRQVLRAEIGQRYELSDNRSVYLAEIESLGKGEVGFTIVEEIPQSAPLVELTLLLALTKFDRFEWALEKGTELGVARFIPVASERSEKGLEQAAVKRMERWQKILRESSQQSRRARMPELAAPVRLATAIGEEAAQRYFLDEDGGVPLAAARTDGTTVAVLIGPEGGWTPAEREQVLAQNWTRITLGPLILRAETAAAAAAAIVMNAWLRE